MVLASGRGHGWQASPSPSSTSRQLTGGFTFVASCFVTSLRHCCCSPATAGHFSWDFLPQLQTNPSYNCTAAYSTYAFANYRGSSSYADLTNRTLYTAGVNNATYGHFPRPCISNFNWTCEVRAVQS